MAVAPAAAASSAVTTNVSGPPTAARYSNPIAATRTADGALVAAALVADAKAVDVIAFDSDGGVRWTARALAPVTWSADAELELIPSTDGVVVVWRGALASKVGRYAVAVSARGEVGGAPTSVGSTLCATEDGLAWLERAPPGPTRARLRPFGDATAQQIGELAPEPTPTLVCGDHAVYAVVEDDDALSATLLGAGDRGPSTPVVVDRSSELPESDPEDEHRLYTAGDDLGVVRVRESGALAARELAHGALGDWRPLKTKLGGDDDAIVAVDGDARSIVVVYTRDHSESCKDAAATARSAHALRVDRAAWSESRVELAPAICGKPIGPFWIAPERDVVGWVDRAKSGDTSRAPITGFSYRRIVGRASSARVELPADAVVDAGCDPNRACFAVALVRPSGSDGMAPEPLRLVRYAAEDRSEGAGDR